MAKTFKNLSAPSELATLKPVSEKDFFDLNDDNAPTQEQGTKIIEAGNTGNPNNTSNKSNTTRAVKAAVPAVASSVVVSDAADGVRQTFVLSRGHLEQLRDYVHARRSKGDYTYSQKQALQEGLDLLFATGAPAAPRPAQARELEKQHRERILKGRQIKGGE